MEQKAFQEYYPEDVSCCYGCGIMNERGLGIKSYWDGEESVAFFKPKEYHTAMKGYVYGGLIASLIDCHGTGTAAAAAYRAENREQGSFPSLRFVTASLKVDYLAPTPIDAELELRGIVKEVKKRKVTIEVKVTANVKLCARGEVIAVLMPESLVSEMRKSQS